MESSHLLCSSQLYDVDDKLGVQIRNPINFILSQYQPLTPKMYFKSNLINRILF